MKRFDKVTATDKSICGELIGSLKDRVVIMDRRTLQVLSVPASKVRRMTAHEVALYERDIPEYYLRQEADKRRIQIQATWKDMEAHSARRANRKYRHDKSRGDHSPHLQAGE